VAPDLSQAVWRKSTKSQDNGGCVEVADLDGDYVAVRDSKNPDGPTLMFRRDQWDAFLVSAAAGDLTQR
jgi:hypothetical protein